MDQNTDKAKTNRLPLARMLAGTRWLVAHRDEAGRLPQGEVARLVGEAIGCRVTVGNLTTMAAAVEVPLHGYAAEAALTVRLDELQFKFDELLARVDRLEAESKA